MPIDRFLDRRVSGGWGDSFSHCTLAYSQLVIKDYTSLVNKTNLNSTNMLGISLGQLCQLCQPALGYQIGLSNPSQI